MAPKIPNAPPDDIFTIDLKPLKGILVDLAPGATRGMRTEQDGWNAARSEILSNQAKLGERAGITATDFNRFVALDGQYGQIVAQLPRVRKAAEVLRESLAHVDNQRHKLATQFADSAESHADAEGGDPTLLTAYEKTIAYRSVIADKAAKTKLKNEAAKAATGSPEPETKATPADPAVKAAATPRSEGVSRIPTAPPDAIFTIDLAPLKGFLVDLPPGATRGMRHEQEGWVDVWHEIVTKQPQYGDRAGITTTDFDRFVALSDQYDQIAKHPALLEKAEEILLESLAHIDNQRHKLVTQLADAAEAHASAEGGDPTLLTAYEKTIAYRSVIADKAAKTRKKNEEAKKAAGGPAEPANG
ncbi:Hypothetical protein A7982_01093 [Minicystis rosea]|nr:Hypothetical protein A7982_01093 [Minicystis rosea]